jgi:hypothetical protein
MVIVFLGKIFALISVFPRTQLSVNHAVITKSHIQFICSFFISKFQLKLSKIVSNSISFIKPPLSLNFVSSSSKRGLRLFPGLVFYDFLKSVKLPMKDNLQLSF